MLWSKVNIAGYVTVIGVITALSGCGFHPLYNQPSATGGGYNVQADLATIEILPIKDRIGQQLSNLLLTRLNPGGAPTAPTYKLRIAMTETVQELGIKKSSFATRANLRVTAQYALLTTADIPKIAAADEVTALPIGNVSAISSYDISTFEFTTQIARKDARNRAVREIADDLRTRLAVYFAQRRR